MIDCTLKKMQSTSMYIKNDIQTIFFAIIALSSNFYHYWMYGFSFFTIICCVSTSGAVWYHCTKNHRKPIRQQEAIVITGCDSGLGYSLALHCHEHLNLRVIAGVHKQDSQGARELAEIGITVQPLDLTQKESIRIFVQSMNDRLKAGNLTLRSVVNNAGTMAFGEFEWQTDDQIYHQINVNLLGTMRLTKEMMPLVRSHGTRLIIVTSHCALESLPGVAAYGASKAGLAAWTTSLRVELKKYGVEVVNFIPGSFIEHSNILSQQQKHFELMAAAMTPEAKQFYSDYFKRYADHFLPLSQNVLPQRLNNPQLYEIFDDALLQQYPRAMYKCEPWRYMFYHTLLRNTPTHIRDWLTEKFVQMPAWNGSNSVTINNHTN